jgi:hypothetical protein
MLRAGIDTLLAGDADAGRHPGRLDQGDDRLREAGRGSREPTKSLVRSFGRPDKPQAGSSKTFSAGDEFVITRGWSCGRW